MKMMKLNHCLTMVGLTVFCASCSHDTMEYQTYNVTDQERVDYAEKQLGVKIDPKQDWVLTRQASVNITADAEMEDIAQVMILDRNVYDGVAEILAAGDIANGGTAKLSFQAPISQKVLYAACVTKDNKFLARPFLADTDTEISFKAMDEAEEEEASESRATRGWSDDAIAKDEFKDCRDQIDLPGLQAEVHAFLPAKTDNKDKVLALDNHSMKVKTSLWGGFAQISARYIYGNSDAAGTKFGYRHYPGSSRSSYQTFMVNNPIDPSKDFDYKDPYYKLPFAMLYFKHDDGVVNSRASDGTVYDFFAMKGNTDLSDDLTRVCIFKVNGHRYMAIESGDDWDYNDMVLYFPSPTLIDIPDANVQPAPPVAAVWTYAFEDKDFGDYDMNDCLVRARENPNDDSKIDITLVAVGAKRNLYLLFAANNKDVFGKELHEALGVPAATLVNTGRGETVPTVTVTLPKPAGFNFQTNSFRLKVAIDYDPVYGPGFYYYDIAGQGQDPHGIVIPGNWSWPTETTSIVAAYPMFSKWATDASDTTAWEWYKHPIADRVFFVK